jgi:hypothetical protein
MLSTTLADFPGKISNFPGKYLGLPLHTRKLRRVGVQPLLRQNWGSNPGLERKAIINGGPGDVSKKCLDGTTDLSFNGLPNAKMAF